MKNKSYLYKSIFQIIVGIAAIIVFFIIKSDGEDMTKWTITFILALIYVILGVMGIIDYKKR